MHDVKTYLSTAPVFRIWANQPIHSFLVGCLKPCLQGTSVRVGLPHPYKRGV